MSEYTGTSGTDDSENTGQFLQNYDLPRIHGLLDRRIGRSLGLTGFSYVQREPIDKLVLTSLSVNLLIITKSMKIYFSEDKNFTKNKKSTTRERVTTKYIRRG